MRIIAIGYLFMLAALILWLVWEWRADVRYRKRFMNQGRRIGDRRNRMPPMN